MATGRQAELTGIVKPDVDEQRLDRETSKVQQAMDKSSQLRPDIDVRGIRRKIERAIPGGDILGGGIDRLTGRGGPTDATGGGVMDGGLQAAQLERLTDIHEELEKIGASGGFGGGGSPAGTDGGGGLLGGLFDLGSTYLQFKGIQSVLGKSGGATNLLKRLGLPAALFTAGTVFDASLPVGRTPLIPGSKEGPAPGPETATTFAEILMDSLSGGEGPTVSVSDITKPGWDFGVQEPDRPDWLMELMNPPWAETAPSWIDSLTQTPGWMQDAPPWFQQMLGGDSEAAESARTAVTEFTEIGIGLGGGATSPIGIGLNTAFEQIQQQEEETTAAEAMSYQPDDPSLDGMTELGKLLQAMSHERGDSDLDGMTNAEASAAAMAYPDSDNTNRAKENRSRQASDELTVNVNLSFRDERELERKLDELKKEIRNEIIGNLQGGVL